MEVYCGIQPPGLFQIPNATTDVVKRLMKPIDKTGRHITMDNFYTLIPLANDLLLNHRTTIIGTIKKNNPQLSKDFKDLKERPSQSSLFGFGVEPNRIFLVSYVPKKNKNVLMLSTFHQDDSTDPKTGDAFKPSVIIFYNMTNGVVNVVDRRIKTIV